MIDLCDNLSPRLSMNIKPKVQRTEAMVQMLKDITDNALVGEQNKMAAKSKLLELS